MVDLSNLCRICFGSQIKMFDLDQDNIKERYHDFLGIKEEVDESKMPQNVCYLCFKTLKDAILFRDGCIDAENRLKNYLQSDQNTNTLIPSKKYKNSNSLIKTADNFEQEIQIMLRQDINDLSDQIVEFSDTIKIEPSQTAVVDNKAKTKKDKSIKKRRKKQDKKEQEFKQESEIQEYGEDCIQSDSEDELNLSKFKEKLLKEELEEDVANEIACISPVKVERSLKDVSAFAEEITLSLEEQIEEVTKRKDSEKYQISLYKCSQCYIGYNHKATFERHMKKHDESSGDSICPVCSVRKSDKYKLAKHRLAAHDKKFKCKTCGHISNTSTQARAHYRWHNGFTYQCQFCGKIFRHPTTFLSHVRISHPTQFVCDICGERFINPSGVNIHKMKAHGSIHQRATEDGPYCSECDIQFTNEEAYSRHMYTSSNHGQGNFDCKFCGRIFTQKAALLEHSALCKIPNGRKTKTDRPAVTCKECGVRVRDGIAYRLHVARVHRPQASSGAAASKMATSVPCDLCDKTFSCPAKMKYHRRKHTGEKPYLCPTCKKGFSALHSVRNHMRTHTGERPFSCDKCQKCFVTSSGLQRHQMVHSGARPYSCPQCGKKFSQSNAVKLHLHTVHLKLPAPYAVRKKQRNAAQLSNASDICT